MNRFSYLEEWLRREPSHNSFRVWINDDGDIRIEVRDFNGTRWYVAPTLAGAVDVIIAMLQLAGWNP